MADYKPFSIDMNMTDVPTWDGQERPLLPMGTYKFHTILVKNTDKGQIEVTSEVVESPLPELAETAAFVGQKAWNNYNYSDATGMKRLKHFMVVAGADLSIFNSDDLMDVTYYGDVVHSEGKPRPGTDGQPLPVKTFANIVNERSVAQMEGQPEEPETERPPVTRGTQPASAPAPDKNAKAKAGTARRA